MKTIKNNSLRLLALLLVGIAQIPLTPVAVSASPLVNDNAQFILPVNNNSVVKENDAFLRSVVDGAGGEVAGIVGDFRPFPKFIIVRPRRGISADLLICNKLCFELQLNCDQ